MHHHLHDGHPLLPGTPDHRSLLVRPPVPFSHRGRFSLDPLYGPSGLAALLRATAFTHREDPQGRGAAPLDDAAGLFARWRDQSNAERMNYLLAVVAGDHTLATAALAEGTWAGVTTRPPRDGAARTRQAGRRSAAAG